MTIPTQPAREGMEAIPVAVAMALTTQLPPVALAWQDAETGGWFAKPHIVSIAMPKLLRCDKLAPGAFGYKCGRERHADPWHMVIQSDRIRGVWRDADAKVVDPSLTDALPSVHESSD